jgi:hypothetical protein
MCHVLFRDIIGFPARIFHFKTGKQMLHGMRYAVCLLKDGFGRIANTGLTKDEMRFNVIQ